MTTSLSAPDSAPHISPDLPKIWRTLAPGVGKVTTLNFSLIGSNRTIAFASKSLDHTVLFLSTYTAYGIGLSPGTVHSFHWLVSGSYIAKFPASHSVTQSLPCESDQIRLAP